ncbi:MAG TPA: PQQ-binding-like beta-propeller repeat protein [Dongiaceae bacterium]|nr:PQQ-binding-like beta-propeller repeat protein [Dongiaceae bacterium]
MKSVIVGTILAVWAGVAAAQTPRPALVVLNKDASELAIVDPATWKVVGRVPTGQTPHEVAVSDDGKIAVATNYGPERNGTTLSVIDLDAQKEIHRVELEELRGPHGVMYLGGKFYFTAEGSNAIARYDVATNKVDWRASTSQEGTHMVVGSPDGGTLFTANIRSNSVSCIRVNQKTGTYKISQIAVGKGPEGIDIAPDGAEVWAANSGDGTVSIIDAGSCRVIGAVDVRTKRSNRVKFTRDGKLALISDLGAGEIVVVDAAARKEVKRVKLGSSVEGILMLPDDARAIVAVSGDNHLAVLDLKTLEQVSTFETGKDPDGMGWRK